MGRLAVASLHLVSLKATETTEGSGLGDYLRKNIDFQLLVRGLWWAVTLSLCRGGEYSVSCSSLWTLAAMRNIPRHGGLPAAVAP